MILFNTHTKVFFFILCIFSSCSFFFLISVFSKNLFSLFFSTLQQIRNKISHFYFPKDKSKKKKKKPSGKAAKALILTLKVNVYLASHYSKQKFTSLFKDQTSTRRYALCLVRPKRRGGVRWRKVWKRPRKAREEKNRRKVILHSSYFDKGN